MFRGDVTFEWGIRGIEALAPFADVAVVVDVLSFSTAVSVAVERGVTVLPYRFDYASAKAAATEHSAVLAVHRRDTTSEEPYSLSPSSLRALTVGTKLLLPSPNGSACCARAAEIGVKHVLIGSLRNAKATAEAARALGTRVAVIAAGEQWDDGSLRPAVEDFIGAGAIISLLQALSPSPEAAVAALSYESSKNNIREIILTCVSGRELAERYYVEDVEIALEINASSIAAIMRDGQIVGLQPGSNPGWSRP